jgi:alkyldihydroxyacetonephosphate synthase
MTSARLKHYGWGREGEGMSAEERTFVFGRYRAKFATDEFDTIVVPGLEDLSLREPRVLPPASLAPFCTTERYDRAAHTYGKSYPDYVRAMLGDYDCAPDVVAYPRNEAEISAVMDWARSVDASLTPFGGGSSVCGGIEPRVDGIKQKAAVTLDLRNLCKVIEVDPVSRAASIESGTYGPSLENQLKPHGFTLRHFPQSFEYSTLGGWIATRSGGHFASLHTHINDFVESLRVVTPVGVLETRRLPGSGAGPSPDHMFIGSEGTKRPSRGVKAAQDPSGEIENFRALYAAARPLGTMATRLYAAVVRFLQRAAALRPPSPLHDKFALSCRPRRCERRSP